MSVCHRSDKDLKVRLNDVDWILLDVMSDGRRYTQTHLDKDIDELEDVSYDWIRQRIRHLHDNGLVEKVGSSSMYVITDYGDAALEIRDEIEDEDLSPIEVGKRIREHAESMAN